MRLVLFAANFKTFYQQTTTESDGNVAIKVSFHHLLQSVLKIKTGNGFTRVDLTNLDKDGC